VVVIGSTSSFAPAIGGFTTLNDFLRVVYQPPIVVTAALTDGALKIEWTGGSGPYRLQTSPEAEPPAWLQLVSPATSPQTIPLRGNRSFYRVIQAE
jgi:hypothetical protein